MNEFLQKSNHEWEGYKLDYQALRKNYRLYTRSAGLLAMLLIFCIGLMVGDTLLQNAGVLLVLAGLFLFIRLLKKRYTNKCNTLLHVDLDLDSWQQYLQLNKNVKKAILQIDMKLTSVAYSFMMGDFDAVIKDAREALSQTELPQKYKNFFESYLIRSIVLTDPNMNREELESQLNKLTITDPTLAEKTKKVCLALYDLTIAHQSNDYFEDLSNDFKYQQLEIIYYQALNATLKGDKSRAEELFRKLVSEDESLYIVQKAQQYLKDEGNYLLSPLQSK